MGQTLTNGIYLPNEGERNCYSGLAANWNAVDTLKGNYSLHAINVDIHVTAAEKETWNGKADNSALTAHTGDTTIHVTSADKQAWNGHVADTTIHVTSADKQAWNGHVADSVKHVTAEDKQAWNGKADASALTAHTGDTTIHVTAEDKTKWDAVTSKADDSGVVHKSGAESIAGLKTFTDLLSIDGDYLGTEASTNQRTNICLRSNRDTADKSGAYITRFRQNRSQGALQTGDLHMIGFDVLENEVRTNNVLSIQCTKWLNDVPQKVDIISSVLPYSYGNSVRKALFNDLNPGALGMPDLSNGIDISSYIPALDSGGNTQGSYTPNVNGFIAFRGIGNGCSIVQGNMGNNVSYVTDPQTSNRIVNNFLPVVKDNPVVITARGLTSIEFIYFFPCQGNV